MRLVIALSLALLSVAASPAQAPVPVEKEPRHHLKFQNSYVRVFDAVVPPGDTTLYHQHMNDYVFVMIGAATMKTQIQGGEPNDLILKDGETRYTPAPVIHRVSNVGKTGFRAIAIEVLEPSKARGAPTDKGSEYSFVLENERVRVHKLTLEPDQSTRTESAGQPEMMVAITQAEVVTTAASAISGRVGYGDRAKKKFKPGDFVWSDGPGTRSMKNSGKTRFEAITVEWK
jgi:mannose-6-phosphate isomerase-like protein (cupin superfamily)